jgi:hypothetical protein
MRRSLIISITLLVSVLVLTVPAYLVTAAPSAEEGEQEAIVHLRTGQACGIERWSVKTGIDADSKRVNTKVVKPTTIAVLTSLRAPSSLPSRNRIASVETTVWSVYAKLIRFKMEADSDYHLVLRDPNGRTLIAEIPASYCVGSQSPFLGSIKYARSQFNARYTVETRFRYVNTNVWVKGVGFFDFIHGQSGVAPNGIELHPVLSIRFGVSGPSPSPTSPPKPSGGSLAVSASVSPNPVSYGSYPALTAKATRGASCSASVVYSTGRPPRSFNGSAKTVGSSGTVSWSWHMESKGTGGTASVTCSLHGQSKTARASFSIA